MAHLSKRRQCGVARVTGTALAAVGGFATAALVGVALARSYTLEVAHGAKVVNADTGAVTRGSIVTTSRGFAVYLLTGDSRRHPKCRTRACFAVWPPVTVSPRTRLGEAPGVSGRLGVWHRDGFLQVTLAGHPLYRYAPDTRRGVATGEAIRSFHGVWHVIKVADAGGTTMPSSTTAPTTTTGTTPCAYPPYC